MPLRLILRLVTIEAFRALARNKVRSALAGLGIVVGVVAARLRRHPALDHRAWRVLRRRSDQRAATVLVIGETVRKELFGAADPLGAHVRIQSSDFTVIGVLAPKGQTAFGHDQDDTIMMPTSTSVIPRTCSAPASPPCAPRKSPVHHRLDGAAGRRDRHHERETRASRLDPIEALRAE